MDPKHFDKLAEVVGRRKILGGALAGLLGLGTARLADVSAKGDNKKGKKQGDKKSKHKVGDEAVCLPGECGPAACCTASATGTSCVPITTQLNGAQQFCGDASGEGTCRTCPPGTHCGLNPFTFDIACVCDAGTCPNGCCYFDPGTGDQQCIVNGSGVPINSTFIGDNGAFVCGTGGSFCNFCSDGNGSPQTFNGCCSTQGFCQEGQQATNCGGSGRTCQVCTGTNPQCGPSKVCTADPPCTAGLSQCGTAPNLTCVNLATNPANCGTCGNVCPNSGNRTGICNGGTCGLTPPPPPPPPAAPACVAPNTFCGGVCVSTLSNPNCGGCGRVCKSCNGGVCVNKKKKKKHHKKH